MITTLVTFVHVSVCLLLVGIVLLQQGKGADAGATFGGGSQTFFGASGADTLLTKVTTGLALLFMVTSVVLAMQGHKSRVHQGNLFKDVAAPAAVAPVAPPPAGETTDSQNGEAASTVEPAPVAAPPSVPVATESAPSATDTVSTEATATPSAADATPAKPATAAEASP